MKYKGVRFKNTPSTQFPEMVTVIRTTKKFRELFGKRYLDISLAYKAVDKIVCESYIHRSKIEAYQGVKRDTNI